MDLFNILNLPKGTNKTPERRHWRRSQQTCPQLRNFLEMQNQKIGETIIEEFPCRCWETASVNQLWQFKF